MNYKKHYDLLINQAISFNRKKLKINDINYVYYEQHHILPKCLGGSNDPKNLIVLTPEEHYVAHLLLVKIYPGIKSLIYSAYMMCVGKYRNNKKYGWIKKHWSKTISEDSDRSNKISKSLTGRIVPESVGRKISISNKGRTVSENTRRKLSIAGKGRPHSEEHKKKIGIALKGKSRSDQHAKNIIISKRLNGTTQHTEETKRKQSVANMGAKWYNNGISQIRKKDFELIPINFIPGRLSRKGA